MAHAVRILARAQADIHRMATFIAVGSSVGAERWLHALDVAVSAIGQDPFAFGLANESVEFSREVREKFFRTQRGRTYRLLYTISEDEVLVLRVRGPGQAPMTSFDL